MTGFPVLTSVPTSTGLSVWYRMQPAPNRASINDAARARRVMDEAPLVALVLVLARYRAGEVDEDGHEDQLDERDSRAGRNTRSVLLAASTARVTVLPRSLNML